MIQFNGENNIEEIHYNGRDIRKVYDHLGKVWEKRPPDYPNEYLTIRIQEQEGVGNIQLTFSRSSNCEVELKYSIDFGTSWTALDYSLSNLETGDTIMLKGHVISQTGTGYSASYGSIRLSNCKFDIEGNIMSLLYGDNFSGQTDLMYPWIFYDLFGFNVIEDASNLILPSMALTNACYCQMFSFCEWMTTAPQLPATTLADICYSGMFLGCSSLKTAPQLPSSTLVVGCYLDLFKLCSSLNHIECHATDVSALSCTQNWLDGVASIGTFKTPSATTWSSGIDGIPASWTRVDL